MKKLLLSFVCVLLACFCFVMYGCKNTSESGSYNIDEVLNANEDFKDYYTTVESIKNKFLDSDSSNSANLMSARIFNAEGFTENTRDNAISKINEIKSYVSSENVKEASGTFSTSGLKESFRAMMAVAFDMPLYLGQIITTEHNATVFYNKTLSIGIDSELMDATYYYAEKSSNIINTLAYEKESGTCFYSTVKYNSAEDFNFYFIEKTLTSNDLYIAYADSSFNYLNISYRQNGTSLKSNSILFSVCGDFSEAYSLDKTSNTESIFNGIESTIQGFSNYIDCTSISAIKDNTVDYNITDEQYAKVLQTINNEINKESSPWVIENNTLKSYTATGNEGDTLEIPEGITAIAEDFSVYVEDGKGANIKKLVLPSTLTTVKKYTYIENGKFNKCADYEFFPVKNISYSANNPARETDACFKAYNSPYSVLFEEIEVNDTLGKSPFVFDDESKTLVTKDNVVVYICDNENVENLDLSAYTYHESGKQIARYNLDKLKTISIKFSNNYNDLGFYFLFDNLVDKTFDLDKLTLDFTAFNGEGLDIKEYVRANVRSETDYYVRSNIKEMVVVTNAKYIENYEMNTIGSEAYIQKYINYTADEISAMLENGTIAKGSGDEFYATELMYFKKAGHKYNTIVQKVTIQSTITATPVYINDVSVEDSFTNVYGRGDGNGAIINNNVLEILTISETDVNNCGEMYVEMSRQKPLTIYVQGFPSDFNVVISPDFDIDLEDFSEDNPFVTINFAGSKDDAPEGYLTRFGVDQPFEGNTYYNEEKSIKLVFGVTR